MSRLTRTAHLRPLLWSLAAVLLLAGTAAAEELVLDRALEIAFNRSPTIQGARHNLEISHRNLQAQRAALKSRFGLTVTPYEFSKDRVFNDLLSAYNTQEQTHVGARFSIRQPIEMTDGTVSVVQSMDWREASSSLATKLGGAARQRTYSSNLYLQYSHPLFTYNRTKLALERLELALENARLGYAIQRLQIESGVTRLFLDLYLKQRNVEISREELINANERYEIIESKVQAGISAREELLQEGLTRANARASLESAQLQYANALDDFRVQLGLPFELDLTVTADVRKELVEVDLKEATRHGLERRMELRQQDIAIQNAMQELVTTDALNEFKGSANFTLGIVGTEEKLGRIYDEPTRNQRVTVSFEVPLFDWGEKRHRMAAARESVARSELTATEERKRIVAEIRQAHRNLQSQRTQIEIAEKNVENARLTYEINLERYRNGDLPAKDIAYYQNQLSREQINEVGVLIQYRLALLDLKIRTLYDFARNQPVAELDHDEEALQ
ncbi:TolC family protein [Candidatus Latescibacterota bacterium]